MKTRPVGDRAVLVEFDGTAGVHRAWRAWREEPPPGVREVVAGASTVLVSFDSDCDPGFVIPLLGSIPVTASAAAGRRLTIPVQYGGPDTAAVAALAGIGARDVARLHSSTRYTVAFVGFSPGFAYLKGADPALSVPRLDTPRRSVPAGSVALAAGMTAVYPQETPGGWRIIGRTDTAMFDPSREPPGLVQPGDRVTFEPVEDVGPAPAWPALPPFVRRPAVYLECLDPGPLCTIQDAGRAGWAHLGVPRAGAADKASARAANRAVGNPDDVAILEATLAGPRLRVGGDARMAVTGAWADVTVDGVPARQDVALILPAGAEVQVGTYRRGVRAYIAVAGLDTPVVLGSRSTDTLSGLGPPAIRAGDVLAVGRPPDSARWVGRPPDSARWVGRPPADGGSAAPAGRVPPAAGELLVVGAKRGPRDGWVGTAGMRSLESEEFVVASSSDRTGVRLEGPIVAVERGGDVPSEGMVAGAVQIPPSGQPIVLLRNHPTTGGYPVAAVVDDVDVDLLAQAGPGVRVHFRCRG